MLDSHVGKKDIDLRSREDNLAETEKEKRSNKKMLGLGSMVFHTTLLKQIYLYQ